MSEPTYDPEATAAGIDASRRVAWARFYAAQADNARLLRHLDTLLRLLARLSLDVLDSEPLQVLDPDGEAMREARRVLASLRARARGRAIVNREEERRSA